MKSTLLVAYSVLEKLDSFIHYEENLEEIDQIMPSGKEKEKEGHLR